MPQTVYVVENCDTCKYIGFTSLEKARSYIISDYFNGFVAETIKSDENIGRDTLIVIKEDIDTLYKDNCIHDYMYIHEVGVY